MDTTLIFFSFFFLIFPTKKLCVDPENVNAERDFMQQQSVKYKKMAGLRSKIKICSCRLRQYRKTNHYFHFFNVDAVSNKFLMVGKFSDIFLINQGSWSLQL